jgi:hypothetical protein
MCQDPLRTVLTFVRCRVCCSQEPTHGIIDLSECLTVKSADEKTDKPHSFEVATPDQTYYMYAQSEKEKDDWIGAIGRCVGQPLSMCCANASLSAPAACMWTGCVCVYLSHGLADSCSHRHWSFVTTCTHVLSP